LEVALADGNKSTSGQIFRCEKDGKITFSDSICEKAPDKKRIIPGPLNSYSSEEQDNLRYPDSRRAKSKSNQSGTSSAAGAARLPGTSTGCRATGPGARATALCL